MTARPAVGTEQPRSENAQLLTGAARFVADVDRNDQLWARIVRSPVSHADIVAIDSAPALAHPGVVGVLTAADLPELRIPIRLPFAETPQGNLALQAPLASDRVRFVGEPVAIVLAEDPYTAEDAAELVGVELAERAPVLALASAGAADEILHDALGSNVVNTIPIQYGNVDEAFERADVVVRATLRMHRHTGMPLETRGLLAEYDPLTERLTVWGAAKVKHFNLVVLAQMLGLPPEQIRLVELAVGGAFGVRGEFYPEDLLVPFAARHFGRPVKWIEDRAEHFVATNHAREQVHELEVAASADGKLLAFRDRAWCDQGAYVRTQGILPPLLPTMHLAGPYAWQAFAIESSGVLTNRTPVGTMRGPGATEATYVREVMLDRVARALDLDPVELRRRNLVPADSIPHLFDLGPGAPPLVYESGDFPAFLETLLERASYSELVAEQQERRAAGELIGIGVAPFVELAGVGPYEEARIEVDSDGLFLVHVGIASVGQGVRTVLAQIAADALGVPFENVRISHHDTDVVPAGFGTFASRSTVLAGNAVALAAADLREKAGSTDDGALDLSAAAPRLAAAGIAGTGRFEKENPSFSFGAALAMVEVDPETGRVGVLRCVVACDVGRAINPALVRGQIEGGAAQGIGAALLEELVYDDAGQPLRISFMDYLLPTALDVPKIDAVVIEHPTPTNPLGIKGVGEAGMTGTPAAVANAVADALGVDVAELPLTPPAVRALLRSAPTLAV
jgi:aerobic carbon-monoxide dehydrogenase large subunit